MNQISSKSISRLSLHRSATHSFRRIHPALPANYQSFTCRNKSHQANVDGQETRPNPANPHAKELSSNNGTQSEKHSPDPLKVDGKRVASASTSTSAQKPLPTKDGKDETQSGLQKSNTKSKKNNTPLPYQNAPSEWSDTSFLSPYLRKYPALYKSVKFFNDGLGMYAKQGDAVRTGKKTYMTCCERDVMEEQWIYETCHIPRTFHSWFQITNLHVWLVTVRLRALPPPHGRYMLQALVDFFFQDIEDRLRALLGPRTSERAITSYMKEYRDLWNGSQLSLDVGLVGGDWELAGAVWRNLFDAKGWDLGGKRNDKGEVVDDPTTPVSPLTSNPQQGANKDMMLQEIPYQVYTFTAFLRRELKRLEEIPDENIILDGEMGEWGRIFSKIDDVKSGPVTQEELAIWQKWGENVGTYR